MAAQHSRDDELNTTEKWQQFATSANAAFYQVEPGVIAVVPSEGIEDDEATAKASIELQLSHLRKTGQRAGVVIFMDRVAHQTAAARTVYRDAPDEQLQRCFALVGGTMFGRAMASIFLGLSAPRVPTRMFATMDAAFAWARERAAAP